MPMDKMYLASSNSHKAKEYEDLFKEFPWKIESAPGKIEVEENGKTFQENAFIKAKAYFESTKTPCFSDDSGLVLPSKPKILGVHSARFAQDLPDYREKCQKLLDLLEGVDPEARKAYFVCYLCFYLNDDEVFFFEGRCHGVISLEYVGEDGFGYDPIFIPDGRHLSFAQDPFWKAENSHRAKAVQGAMRFFNSSFNLLKTN